MLPRSRRCVLLLMLTAPFLGCEPGHEPDEATSMVSPFGGGESVSFDFGKVVGESNSTYTHAYSITNESSQVVTILELLNGKTCCGRVGPLDKTVLQPGATATFSVTIIPGDTIGPLSHWATVKTDHPGAAESIFWTTADVVPRTRITHETGGIIRMRPNGSKVLQCAYVEISGDGTFKDPGELSASDSLVEVAWTDDEVVTKLDESNLTERRRPFQVVLKAGARIGPRRVLITVEPTDGGQPVTTTVLYQVDPALVAHPARVDFAARRSQEKTIIVSSTSREKFRVTAITADVPGVVSECLSNEPNSAQFVRIRTLWDDREELESSLGTLKVTTDSAEQQVISIPIVVTADRSDR